MVLQSFLPARAKFHDGQLTFVVGDLGTALRQGCFALRIPDELDLAPGIRLAQEFYLAGRGVQDREGIYFDQELFQTDHVLIDGPRRRKDFPQAVNLMCEKMCALARFLLRIILTEAGISESLWADATDDCVTDGGVQWFALGHYQSDRNLPGAPAHKDPGFITVLYYDKPGLEAYIDGEWRNIPPVGGYFLINFGGALEILTAKCSVPVKAVLHRVRQCLPASKTGDHFSFAVFLNPAADGDVIQASADGKTLVSLGSVDEYLRTLNKMTWHDGYAAFGITRKSHDMVLVPQTCDHPVKGPR
ncbi:2OG-Fe(II) oxygenase [Beijerinckia indica subsp. indica ATCC 9039]|uniref:2OG-Fe(II) oxygenase n=2 Tax=Beijerinckia TaxID=532 RepID=B2IL03_BEII9|nr:2OG-Fe(II) oxygenase [Beijerinckia indica subsp. indica ATCC 9039]